MELSDVDKRFRAVRGLDDWLEHVNVHSPGMWENDAGPLDWYAVSDDDLGIIAYFAAEVDAFRFRLDYINRQLNP